MHHVGMHTQAHTHMCVHTYIHIPTRSSHALPLASPSKEEERKRSTIYHFSPNKQCPFCPEWDGGGRQPMSGLGKEPLWPIFHRHPRRSCCQEHCLISSLTAGLDPPTKEGIVSSSAPWASAPQRSAGGRKEGIWGIKALHPVPQPFEGSQILELKELASILPILPQSS